MSEKTMTPAREAARLVPREDEEAWIVLSQAQFLEARILELHQLLRPGAISCFPLPEGDRYPLPADSIHEKRDLLTRMMLDIVGEELDLLRDQQGKLLERVQKLCSRHDATDTPTTLPRLSGRGSQGLPAFLLGRDARRGLQQTRRVHPEQIASQEQGLQHLKTNLDCLASCHAQLVAVQDTFPRLELPTHEFHSRAFRYSDLGRALEMCGSADANLTLGKMCLASDGSVARPLERLQPLLPRLLPEVFQDVLLRGTMDSSAGLVRSTLSSNSRVVQDLRGRRLS